MRRSAASNNTSVLANVPRGWVILGAASASWLVFAALAFGAVQLFGIVAKTL